MDEFNDKSQKCVRVKSQNVNDEELSLINKHTIEKLKKEDVFTFKMVLSNNEIDRDFERMSVESLTLMASIFTGKTVIVDHERKSKNQFARIYDVELVTYDDVILDNGEKKTEAIAKVYTLNIEKNKDMIAEIKAGIKKEVSIGFKIKSAVCSICGKDNVKESCNHFWGREYEGKTCYFTLGIKDVYEVSFVAIPAVVGAGVVKSYGNGKKEKSEVTEEKSCNKKLALKIKIAQAMEAQKA